MKDIKDMGASDLEKYLTRIRITPSPSLDESVRRMADEAERSGGAPSKPSAVAETDRPRRLSPWLVRIAACLALACGVALALLWAGSNGYRITPSALAQVGEALDNMEKSEWVHFAVETNGVKQEMWYSFNPQRVFGKTGNEIVLWDRQTEREWKYDPTKNTVTILECTPNQYPFPTAKSFLGLMTSQLEEVRKAGDVTTTESGAEIGGTKQTVITMTQKDRPGWGRYYIDPAAKRITRIEILEASAANAGQKPVSIDIEYPERGPTDIYAIGVPRDATVLNNATGWNVVKLRNQVVRASKAFSPNYSAIVCTATLLKDGKLDVGRVQLTYKRDGAYRIEDLALHDSHPTMEPPQNLAAFLEWAKNQPRYHVDFFPAGQRHGTRVEMRKPGTLSHRRIASFEPHSGSVEGELWDRHKVLSMGTAEKHVLLPDKQGENGTLVGVERRTTFPAGANYPAGMTRVVAWMNPARDWITERTESPPGSTSFVVPYVVQEYDRTADGHWYAKRILTSLGPGSSQLVTLIYLDTKMEIPSDLMDPAKLTSTELFDQQQAKWQEAFDEAIVEIDGRATWPATPEDVAKTYLEAGAQGRWDEVAVLCPGSRVRNRSDWHGPQGEWVLGKPQKLSYPIGDPFSIPCAFKDRFEKDGKYTYTIYVTSALSKKHRYYISSGPYRRPGPAWGHDLLY